MAEPTVETSSPSAMEQGNALQQPQSPTSYDLNTPTTQEGMRQRTNNPSTTSPITTTTRSQTGRTDTSAAPNTALPAGETEKEQHHSKRRLSYWQALIKPKKPVGETPSIAQSIRSIVFASWLNLLLVFIPVSWALHFAIDNDTVIFVTAFLAIIPLAKLMGVATEELSIRVGETLGGLLNATLGNAVELIVAIIALVKCQLRVVQASLIGSILSNLLLVLGMCFFAGGTKFATQGFLISASQLNSSLLTLSVVAVLIPATFHAALSGNTQTVEDGTISNAQEGQDILKMSRGVAIILLFIYGCMLTYQLWSHAHLYDSKNKEDSNFQASQKYPESLHNPLHTIGNSLKKSKEALHSDRHSADGSANHAPTSQEHSGETAVAKAEEEEEEAEEPTMSVAAAVTLLIIVTVLVAFTAEFLVDSINGLVEKTPLSQEWVGLILLPIVGNAAEHVTAVTVSVKDKLDLSIGVAVGSSIQISLLVIPFIVVLGWIIGKPLTLLFDPFEAVVLFLTVVTVNYVVADGQSNWLEGMILMCLYVIIAVALWFYPGSDPASTLLHCT